jgi:hypothetical protein
MKIKVDPNAKQPEPGITLTEAFDQIANTLDKMGRDVGADRKHAVETQLRSCIYHMGYRPREKEGKKLTITELAAQAKQAIGILEGKAPEGKHENLALYVTAVLSNVLAEAGEVSKVIPIVPELPAPAAEK